jgi:twitching motility two-component system response regulator PilH
MPVKKILIVDDSPSDRQFLLEKLAQHGYECVLADNGDEAIAKAKTELPDLILMDVIMPGTNGFEATREIARDERTRSIPVILCTGKKQETDRLWGLRQGARDYVTKPIDHRALIAKIAAIA